MSLRRKLVYLAVANGLALLMAMFAVEVGGRLFLLARGAYDVVFLQPDRAVGWKQVPNLHWRWAGMDWYARDYSVDLVTNSHGFRDRERSITKARGTVRLALLGDSFVEAIQVPLDLTAGGLLERRLNAPVEAAHSPAGPRYEVLNFGISNYGVGQYLLTWEAYASAFSPDYVFAFVAGFHMARTVERYETGAFRATARRSLWIRPSFRLQDGALVREPARDFDQFVRVQEQLIREEFAGKRMRRREPSVVGHYVRWLWPPRDAGGPRLPAQPAPGNVRPGPEETLEINLRVLRELGAQVRNTGAVFVIVDVAEYFDRSGSGLSTRLARLCAEKGFGYVPLAERLVQANRDGRATRWPHDGHFNEAGNEIFADTLYEWMTMHVGRPRGDFAAARPHASAMRRQASR